MINLQRPLIAQQFTTFGFTVPVAPAAPLAPQLQITAMIDSFAITVPTAAANSVILGGDPGVVAGPPPTGLELLAGTTVLFLIDHGGRQLYEIQSPTIEIDKAVQCRDIPPEAIPFVVWDVSQIYLVAVAPTSISVALFKAMYI